MSRTHVLRHLPSRGQNVFYIMLLVLLPILNVVINVCTHEDIRRISERSLHAFSVFDLVSEVSGVVLGVLIALMGLNLVYALRRHRYVRHSLFLFGVFSSLYLALNLYAISYGVFAFRVQSSSLLLVSSGVYVSLNIVFLFWYWYLGFPSQVERLHHSDRPVQILFPVGVSSLRANRLPSVLDYLYFTVMVSNTLGSPESHLPCGSAAKVVQVVHSTLMLVLLVIFVSRAINTLA